MLRRLRVLVIVAAGLSAATTQAQNTGGVFGPVVTDGHRSAQYRLAFDPDDDRLAQRVHYQWASDDRRMIRLLGQVRRDERSGSEFDFIQGELFWQLGDKQAPWKRGLRFDLRLQNDERPEVFGFHWMHQYSWNDHWQFRGVLLTSVEFGDNARSGIRLGSRVQLARTLQQGRTVGLQWYSDYGSTADFRNLSDQNHQVGPFVSARIGKRFSILGRALAGLTEATPDLELGVWITRNF